MKHFAFKPPRMVRTLTIASASVFVLLLGIGLFWFSGVGRSVSAATTLTVDIPLNSLQVTRKSNDPASGPQVATLWGKVTNSGSERAINVSMNLGSFTNSLALLTNQTATYNIPILEAGASQAFFWFVTYSLTESTVGAYTIAADADNASSVQGSSNLTTTSMTSASSNKITSITASTSTVAVGETITITVNFDLGQVSNNGNAWLQPAANLSYDPSILRLISAQVTLDSVAQTPDALFFSGLGGQTTGNVVYTFQGASTGSTSPQPYQHATSGGQQKYSADSSALAISIESTPFEGTVNLDVTPTSGATTNDPLTFTVTVGNPGDQVMGDPNSGNGVVVDSDIPTNTT